MKSSNNNIKDCISFSPKLCTSENAWSSGDKAIGSILSFVNLNYNKIEKIGDLSHHKLIEILLLSRNSIYNIEGISNLKYLKVFSLII